MACPLTPATRLRSAPPKANCLIFVLKDCPIANRYAPELRRIVSDYEKRGVKFQLVFEDADITPAEATAHAKEYKLAVPATVDVNHSMAQRRHVMISPTAVIETQTELAYVGRIDDTYMAIGKRREKATSRDLRNALDDVLAGRAVRKPRTDAIGCMLF